MAGGIKCPRILLEEMPMSGNGEGAGENWESCQAVASLTTMKEGQDLWAESP